MQTLWQDLRYGMRMLLKNPGFTLMAVLTLALGIGASITIFSLVNAVLLKSLPVIKAPHHLITLGRTEGGQSFNPSSYPDYRDYRDRNTVFSGLAAYASVPLSLSSSGFTERLSGAVVSGNYFSVLGVEAVRGRILGSEDDIMPDAHPVAVISFGLWRRSFGSDPAIIGRTVRLNTHPFTVVGVAAEGFRGTEVGEVIEVWVPMMMAASARPGATDPTVWLKARNRHWLQIIGRLKAGVTRTQAQAGMDIIAAQLREQYPKENKNKQIWVSAGIGFDPDDRAEATRFLGLIMAAVGLVWLIACANVANLMLVRATSRRKEIAIRLALGAPRARLTRQFLTESLILSVMGTAAGLLIPLWTRAWLLSFFAQALSPAALDFSLDGRIVGMTLFLSLATGLLFGLAPALQASRPDLVPELKDAAATLDHRNLRLGTLLVVAQVALSLVLLVSAGLLVRTLQKAYAVNPGFETKNLLALTLDLKLHGYDEQRGQLFFRQLTERVAALPGVQAASLALTMPLSWGAYTRGIVIDSQPATADGRPLEIDTNVVTAGYFRTMGMSLVGGRDFNERDAGGAADVVIVNEAMARRLWPGRSPIGERFKVGRREVEIIGVARSSKYRTVQEEYRPVMYMPLMQSYEPQMVLHVRTATEPVGLLTGVRREVRQLDQNLAVFDVKTLDRHLDDSLWPERTLSTLGGIFGLLALGLAMIGLYGVISYAFAQRTREIGIRLALGAQTSDVLWMVLGEGVKFTLIGVAIGLCGAWAATRMLASFLFGVSATDPLTFISASLILIAVALVACYLPARRATKVDPMVALRCD